MILKKMLTGLYTSLPNKGGVGGGAVLLLCLLCSSCGLLDYDLDGNPDEVAVTMHLDRDTMYVMTGDRFTLTPLFDPDTVNIGDLFFNVDHPNIVGYDVDGFEALSPGWTKIYAMSVSSRISDSCTVCVLEPWDYVVGNYPDETIIYAEITINGVEPSEDATFTAFVGSEVRAFGDYNIAYDQVFYIFRVRHPLLSFDTPMERIIIYYYDSEEHNLYTATQWFYTDGESHGTPSNPIKIDLR